MKLASTTRIKFYAITYWVMVRLGLAQVDQSHSKRSEEEKRNHIVKIMGQEKANDPTIQKLTIVDENYKHHKQTIHR